MANLELQMGPQLEQIHGEIRDNFRAISNGFQKLDKIKDSIRQSKQLEELTGKMRECKRLIKEFDREIKDEEPRNPPEVNKQLNDEKQSMIKELNSYVALRKTMLETESKPVIGLSWEPKLPSLSFGTTKPRASDNPQNLPETSAAYRPNKELIDGLFVPPNNPMKLNKLLRKQVKDTSGKNWFDMPAPTITPELKKDLQLLKLRSAIDPKRHYKKGDSKSKTLPKYFQIGTVIESASEFYTGRLSKEERKATLADELLSDPSLGDYRKRKVREIEEQHRPGGVEKWKIRGQQSRRRAKQRRH